MKLRLNNIKQHHEYILETPDKGLVLFKGPSGAGKSSILEAIYTAFGGDTDDMASWGCKSSTIELDFLSLHVIKTTSPNTLCVTAPDGTQYRDEAALGVIMSKLGMNLQEFDSASYVKQNGAASLLNLKQTAQMNFIQKLVSGNVDVEKIRKYINDEITAKGKLLAAQEQKVASLDSQLSKYTEEISIYKVDTPSAPEYDAIAHTQIQQSILELEGRQSQLKQEYWKVSALLKHPIWELEVKYHSQQEMYDKSIKDLELERDLAGRELELIPAITTTAKADVKAQIDQAQKEMSYLDIKDKINELSIRIREAIPDAPETKLGEYLSSKTQELESTVVQLRDRKIGLTQRQKMLQDALKVQPCPVCAAELRVISNIIKKADMPTTECKDELAQIPQQIIDIDTQIAAIQKQIATLQSFSGEILLLKGRLIVATRTDKTKQQLQEIFSTCTIQLNDLQSQEVKRSTLSNKLDSIQYKIAKVLAEISQFKDKFEAAKSTAPQMTRQQISDTLQRIDSDIIQVENELHTSNTLNRQYYTQRDARQTYDITQAKLSKIQSYYDQTLQDVSVEKSNLEDIKDQYTAAVEFKALNTQASMEAIEDIIRSINANAKFYLEILFPEGGTSVVLNNKKTLQNGDEKAEISLAIYHKGNQVKKLSSLSGGERSRLTLAFQLAMSDLYNSPILMIDEGFTGLSLEGKESCLEVVKRASETKLVLIVEHGAPESYFDLVVEV